MKLIDQIRDILGELEETRNSDALLAIRLWSKYYSEWLKGEYISLAALQYVPSIESIARLRRKVQSEGLYQATDERVLTRRLKIKKVQRDLGYKTLGDLTTD